MRYMGGKFRQSKKIAELIEQHRNPDSIYLEPFVGTSNVIEKISGIRIGSDINEDLIALYRAVQLGWKPPNTLTRKQYTACKKHPKLLSPQFRAFVGFGCSYAGKWFGGFACGDNRDFANECHRGLLKQLPKIKGVIYTARDYRQWNPYGMTIYCDPPYNNTTKYDATGNFNSDEFWKIVLKWANQDNVVFVSEYSAPEWVKEIYRWNTKTTLINKGNGLDRTDKLYLCKKD